jgi:hypothetical protein
MGEKRVVVNCGLGINVGSGARYWVVVGRKLKIAPIFGIVAQNTYIFWHL